MKKYIALFCCINPLLFAKEDPFELLASSPDEMISLFSDAKARGHRTFENTKSGEKIRHDEGRPGAHGHKGYDHYHRPNPNGTTLRDEYLDANGNPVPDGSDRSHIYSPEKTWWK